VTVTETRGLPGVPASAAAARAFVAAALRAEGCPDTSDAELCASELVANSARHSLSSGPAGTIVVRVDARPGSARIEVRDRGPRTGVLPAAPADEPPLDGESGRGLWLVSQAAYAFGSGLGVTWCQFFWPADGADTPAAAEAAPARASRRAQRRHGPVERAAHRVAEWRHRRYAARPAEREARDVLGVPWRYPENLTRELPKPQEENLAALADELDLDQMCAAVITELRRQEGQQP